MFTRIRRWFTKRRYANTATKVAAVLAFVAAVVLFASALAGTPVAQTATVTGSLLTAVGVLLAFLSLRAGHEWNRRHATMQFLGTWSRRGRHHLATLEAKFPEFFNAPDFIEHPELRERWCIDRDLAERLVRAGRSEDEEDDLLQIRESLVELLNYFEEIAIAYEHYVMDRQTIEESMAPVILDLFTYFHPFVDTMREVDRRDPWPPLSRVSELWLTRALQLKAQENASDAAKRYRDALSKSAEKLREPTER